MQFGFSLPQVIRESYLVCDGQEAESAAGCSEGLFFGLTLLPLEDVLEEWRFWREVDSDPATGANENLKEIMQSVPPGWVRREYSQGGWIPLIADRAGNYVGVDLNPAENGQVGQVIAFGRDFDTKVVLWRGDGLTGWAKWLAAFVEELENGEGFELGPAETSDDSEDELGYESYFYDGKGRGQGDGGGDTGGVGGLRLTGEYKGWNVMEAWADRSLRKWHETGVITDVPLYPPEEDLKGKVCAVYFQRPAWIFLLTKIDHYISGLQVTDKVGLGVMDVNRGSGAEIPIPVLADVDEPIPPPTNPGINGKRASQKIPTISVTKAPAPLPVDLPTAQDIIEESPSPPHTSFDDEDGDLEAGRGRGLATTTKRETSLSQQRQQPSPSSSPGTTATRRPGGGVQPPPIEPVPHGTVDPLTDVMSPQADATTPLVPAVSSLADIDVDHVSRSGPVVGVATPPDLLVDSGRPSLDAKPIEPLAAAASGSSVSKLVGAEGTVSRKKDKSSEGEEEDDEEEDEEKEEKKEEDEELPPQNSIRLIGGGGTSGSASVPPLESQSSEDSETVHVESAAEIEKQKDADVSSVKSIDSSSSSPNRKQRQQQGHKKTKSGLAAGFTRRFSGFGGLKKKDSAGSVKSVKETQQQ
jgi:cell wall assembly regulator SMI1